MRCDNDIRSWGRLALVLTVVNLVTRVQGQSSKFWSVASGDCFIGQGLSCAGQYSCFVIFGQSTATLSPDANCVSTTSFPLTQSSSYGSAGCVINANNSAWDGYVINVDYFGMNAQDFLVVNGQKFQSRSCPVCSDGTTTSPSAGSKHCGCMRMPGLQGVKPQGSITFNITQGSPNNNYGNPPAMLPALGFRLCPIAAAQNAALPSGPSLSVSQIIGIVIGSVIGACCCCLAFCGLCKLCNLFERSGGACNCYDCLLFSICCPCFAIYWWILLPCKECCRKRKHEAPSYVAAEALPQASALPALAPPTAGPPAPIPPPLVEQVIGASQGPTERESACAEGRL